MTYYSWNAIRPLISEEMMNLPATVTVNQADHSSRKFNDTMKMLDFLDPNIKNYACQLGLIKYAFNPVILVTLTDIDLIEDAELCTSNDHISIFDVLAINKDIIVDITDKSLAFNPINIDIYDADALEEYVIDKITVRRDSAIKAIEMTLIPMYQMVAHVRKVVDPVLDNTVSTMDIIWMNGRVYAAGEKTYVTSPKTGKKYTLIRLIDVGL